MGQPNNDEHTGAIKERIDSGIKQPLNVPCISGGVTIERPDSGIQVSRVTRPEKVTVLPDAAGERVLRGLATEKSDINPGLSTDVASIVEEEGQCIVFNQGGDLILLQRRRGIQNLGLYRKNLWPASLRQDSRQISSTVVLSKGAGIPLTLNIQRYIPPRIRMRNVFLFLPSPPSHPPTSPGSRDRMTPQISKRGFKKNGPPRNLRPTLYRPLMRWLALLRKEVGASFSWRAMV